VYGLCLVVAYNGVLSFEYPSVIDGPFMSSTFRSASLTLLLRHSCCKGGSAPCAPVRVSLMYVSSPCLSDLPPQPLPPLPNNHNSRKKSVFKYAPHICDESLLCWTKMLPVYVRWPCCRKSGGLCSSRGCYLFSAWEVHGVECDGRILDTQVRLFMQLMTWV
jgi:hypothetical protein